MNWNIAIISISVLMSAFGVFKELGRANRSRLPLRIVATIIAIAALACLALPLTYQKESKEEAASKLVLLTPGFDKDSLSNQPDSVICTFDSSVHKTYPKVKLITAIREAAADAGNRQLHVYGYGLTESELSTLHRNIVFHPTPQPEGLTAVHWLRWLPAGDKLNIQGTIKNTSGNPLILSLKGFGTTLDSVAIPVGSSQTFSLNTMPKHTGRAVYHLLGISKDDTLYNELVPVNIIQATPLRLLLLTSSPDFESKFLKNWLAANGYAVSSRSLISKGKYSQDIVNMEKIDLDRITPGLLEKFDLLVSDVPAINALSAAETSALQGEVSQKSLGLLVRADSADKLINWPARNFVLGRIAGRPAAAGALQLAGKGTSVAKLVLPPLHINPNTDQQTLVSDVQGHALAANTLSGAGKIGITLINNTYTWMLEGSKADYASLWSAIISKMARKQNTETGTWVSPQFPVAGEPASIVSAGSASVNGINMAPKQDVNVPFEHESAYWPETVGWQQTGIAAGKTYWWFAWPKNSWTSVKAAEKLQATKAYAAAHPAGATVTKQIQRFEAAPVPKIYFYILLLVAVAFLWAEGKYAGY